MAIDRLKMVARGRACFAVVAGATLVEVEEGDVEIVIVVAAMPFSDTIDVMTRMLPL